MQHEELRQLYADLLVEVFQRARQHRDVLRVLDLGAGEGSVTLPMLELGAHVTAVDISADQLEVLKVKYARFGDRLEIRCGDIAELMSEGDVAYDVITANSFLYHIPDYLGMLEGLLPRLSRHGQFFSFQDPLFYGSQSRFERGYDKMAYGIWRLGRGDVWAGLQRRLRRARGVYLPDSIHDNSEFHALRDGVNQAAIAALFQRAGYADRIVCYFSTQARVFQSLGAALGLKNTFAFIASPHAAD